MRLLIGQFGINPWLSAILHGGNTEQGQSLGRGGMCSDTLGIMPRVFWEGT